MGSLRFILAISVVLSHTYGHLFVGGRLAVQMFYIISGFLISFILKESLNYKDLKKFYLNRFLRLFPVYYFSSLILLVLYIYQYSYTEKDIFFHTFHQVDFIGKLYYLFSNLFILGQDFAFFSVINDGKIQPNFFFGSTELKVYNGHLSHVSWTLSLEIMFYILAPFIIHRKLILIVILFSSIILRLILIYFDIGMSGGFTYRFFPLEIALFILGSLSHQILSPIYKKNKHKISNLFTKVYTFCFLIFCLVFSFIPNIHITTFFAIFLIIISLPVLFDFQNSYKFDRLIGSYSYPIYIAHFPAIIFVQMFVEITSIYHYTFFTFFFTLILSHIMVLKIIDPIEKIRIKNKINNTENI